MGQVFNNFEFGNFFFELWGEGCGFFFDSINVNFDGNIIQFEVFGYVYQGLSFDGWINVWEFEG